MIVASEHASAKKFERGQEDDVPDRSSTAD
jgi:hypothetical protein